MSRNRIRKSEKREKKMIYEEGKRKLYIIHQQPKYNSGQTLTIGRASLWRANLCATFLGNLVYPTPASKMLHFP